MHIVTEQKEILTGIHIPYFLSDASMSMVKIVINTSYNFPWLNSPLVDQDLFTEASRSHSDTPHSIGLLWTSDQPDAKTSLSDNTQYSQETDIHAPGRIQTRHPSKRAASDPRLRAHDRKL